MGSASPCAHKGAQLDQRAARRGAGGPFSKQNVANARTAKLVQVLGEFAGESPGLVAMMLSTGEPLEELLRDKRHGRCPVRGDSCDVEWRNDHPKLRRC